jgi:glycerol-3-phosphate dehydrogenase
VRRLAEPEAAPLIAPSQGVHLVFDRAFLPGNAAIMVPHTRDGRVLFAIPWHGRTLVGTTDTPLTEVAVEPRAQEQEIAFILETAAGYLQRSPTRADVRAVFAGIRPLVRPHGAARGVSGTTRTASLSRDHTIHIDGSGLLTIAGGKWTTYRHMAEDAVDQAELLGQLDDRPCTTRALHVHGWHAEAEAFGALSVYGADAPAIVQLQREHRELREPLDPAARGNAARGDAVAREPLPYTAGEVVWAARHEWARTVEDVLARRTRALFLDARAAIAMAPRTAELLAAELGRDRAWAEVQVQAFTQLAAGYLLDT